MRRRAALYSVAPVSERDFLEAAAKARTAEVVRAVEAETSVEVVVAVRRAASRHFAISLAVGLGCAVLGFAVMWLSPQVYDVRTMPLDVALAFLLGTGLVASVPALRRALTPAGLKRARAERAARAAFSELGIDKTRERSGLLVYVALFERAVVLLPDRGIPATLASGPLAALGEALTQSVRKADLESFLRALRDLGPACAARLPRRADDKNELCDHVA